MIFGQFVFENLSNRRAEKILLLLKMALKLTFGSQYLLNKRTQGQIYTVESLIESGLYLEFGILEPDSIRVRTLFKSGLYLKISKFSKKEIIKYLGILLHTIKYLGILLHTIKYLGILLHTKLYCICICTPMIVLYTRVV